MWSANANSVQIIFRIYNLTPAFHSPLSLKSKSVRFSSPPWEKKRSNWNAYLFFASSIAQLGTFSSSFFSIFIRFKEEYTNLDFIFPPNFSKDSTPVKFTNQIHWNTFQTFVILAWSKKVQKLSKVWNKRTLSKFSRISNSK